MNTINDETMRYDAINRPVSVSHRFSDTRLSDTDAMHRLSDAMHPYRIAKPMRYRCIASLKRCDACIYRPYRTHRVKRA
ncbi:hypothetical protein PGT21_034427 [Puccinia graminis f. sp. tritici]|uniref:Uncharacterized protein n=1 Tax=Puccinia graminis f. sp. tritici TaxID=56615 RepID=A0A5B0NQC5_PUCGR|nr:hypothetical protein PGT21_034427 [Puccinia graminis f. sp. tritici]